MPKILISTLFIIALLLNCTQQNTNTASERINGNKLELLVKDAIRGNAISNFKLSGFLISYTPPGENYNKLIIDSTVTSSGIKLYSVLLEFPNPVFNILAVYDENLSLYLQDNSLNGNIAVVWENISEKQYLVSSENFLSKDRIELSGEVPSPINPPKGCRFGPRCRYAKNCKNMNKPQNLIDMGNEHFVACARINNTHNS
ncbi:MAG: hypothetical protein P8X91_05190 [Candidatus Bathyarchaeota archaeon]